MAQKGLVSLGFDPGPADGLFGGRTRTAIRRYQREKGFAETGYLTEEEARALVALGEETEREHDEREQLPEVVFPPSTDAWDDGAYAVAKRRNTKEAYEEYLAKYPRGRHVRSVRSRRRE